VATGTPAEDAVAGWVVPHLVQNLAPLARVAPQELQNAMVHLAFILVCGSGGVYRRCTVPAG
jgi:hypothetical protein